MKFKLSVLLVQLATFTSGGFAMEPGSRAPTHFTFTEASVFVAGVRRLKGKVSTLNFVYLSEAAQTLCVGKKLKDCELSVWPKEEREYRRGSHIPVFLKKDSLPTTESFVGKGSMYIATWSAIDFGWNNKAFTAKLRKAAAPRFKPDGFQKMGQKILDQLKPAPESWLQIDTSRDETMLNLTIEKKNLVKARLVQLWWHDGGSQLIDGVAHAPYHVNAMVLELLN